MDEKANNLTGAAFAAAMFLGLPAAAAGLTTGFAIELFDGRTGTVSVASGEFAAPDVARADGRIRMVWKGHPRLGADFTATAEGVERDGAVEWTFSCAGNESGLPLGRIAFPVVDVPCADDGRLLYSPDAGGGTMGWKRRVDWKSLPGGKTVASTVSPGFRFVAVLNGDDRDSFYLDVRDPKTNAGRFEVRKGPSGTARLAWIHDLPLTPASATAYRLPFAATARAYRGDWFEAASFYREWAKTTPRFAAAKRRDMSKLRDVGLWMWNRGLAETVIPPVERFQSDTGLKVALDWYWWCKEMPGTFYPDYWPPREGAAKFKADVQRLRRMGVFTQVYLNGMTWDEDVPSWRDGGLDSVAMRRDGSYFSCAYNRFNPDHHLANLCGEAPKFQSRIHGQIAHLVDCGFDSIYLDMIGCNAYGPCFNPAHRHAPGGGSHMTDDFRAYLKGVKAAFPGVLLSTEDCGEAYLDMFDSNISTHSSYERHGWIGTAPDVEFVPVFQAVYHGCTAVFGNYAIVDNVPYWDQRWPMKPWWSGHEDSLKRDYPDQFAVEFARGPAWGLQPSVHNFWMHHATNAAFASEYRFIRDTAKFYHDNREFLFDGEMCHPGRLSCGSRKVSFAKVSVFDEKVSSHASVLPAVFHNVWRSPDGRVAAILVNWTREPQEWRLEAPDVSGSGTLPPRSWACVGGQVGHLRAGDVRGDGMIPFLAITGRPTEAEVRAKVAAIQAQGMDSFLVYARSGLELEYMGEEWLALNEWFCDEAERRGMKVWLYDEYNWPSGTCKGRVPGENDAWRYAELGVYRNADGTYRWASAPAPAGWVNVCEPAAVARFIELTHEAYAKRLSRWFANGTILGIFTDEPGHPVRVTFPEGRPLVSFRKYSGLEDEYLAATGRTLRGDVEKWLETKEGDVWPTYISLVGRRFRTSYFDQIRAWCDGHGILFTGHLISENDPYGSARSNGNAILCLRGESLPGIDEIGSACDADADARPRVEWLTYNLARQAVLHRGNGGLAELYACGPADLVPATLRAVMWLCAFHGIDHYVTCMDVMDERGLVEKHGYLSPTGPIHPWYERHARVLADEARVAAAWARKVVAEREVAVRYPSRAAAQIAIAGRAEGVPGPSIRGLLRALELNQFACRLVDENEQTDLPLVFSCPMDGSIAEERTGGKGMTLDGAIALCRERMPATFSVFEGDGSPATNLLVRVYADGTAAVLNLQQFSDRTLVAERNGSRAAFDLPARGVVRFAAGDLPPPPKRRAVAQSLASVDWSLLLSAPNVRRVNFDEAKKGLLVAAAPLKDVRLVAREYAISYAVTASGRPVGLDEQPAKNEKVIRHIAEPYSFEMDGAKVVAPEPCTTLRPCYDPLYRQTAQFDLSAGEHRLAIASGEADKNYFLPALFVVGDFVVHDGALSPRPKGPVKLGSLKSYGLGDFTGTATWSAEVTVPATCPARLRLATGGRVARVVFDGKDLGVRAWAPFEWEMPAEFAGRRGRLEVSVSTSVQPMFGDPAAGAWDMRFWFAVSGPDAPCGLLAADWID